MNIENNDKMMDNNLNTSDEIRTPEILNLDYRYVRLLGEGANGRTWLAKSRKNGLDVAIKELKFADDFKAWELFHREAEVLQSIKVDGVPKLIESVFAPDFTSYIVQEYIPYHSLEYYLENGEIFEEDEVYSILELTSRILFALQTQYIPAIIHRDIKPGNILYRRATPNSDAKVWLIDFGAVDNAHKQSSGSTIAGTFGYMSPEQLQGEVSPRSDFYSLGATALHLLTGVFPYEIPSELFKLQFHPVIDEKAPDTTKPMVDFLDFLLASSAENRPQDILELRKSLEEARKASIEYRKINVAFELPDPAPRTKLGQWFRKTKIGTKLHALKMARIRRRFENKRVRMLRKFEKMEAQAKKKRLEYEKLLQQEREKNGIKILATVKRVSVAGTVNKSYSTMGYDDAGRFHPGEREDIQLDENILEAVFQHDGNWYPAYLRFNKHNTFKCSSDADEKEKIQENTFMVEFVPSKTDIHIPKNQVIWLDEELYTKFTGLHSKTNKGLQTKPNEVKKKKENVVR